MMEAGTDATWAQQLEIKTEVVMVLVKAQQSGLAKSSATVMGLVLETVPARKLELASARKLVPELEVWSERALAKSSATVMGLVLETAPARKLLEVWSERTVEQPKGSHPK